MFEFSVWHVSIHMTEPIQIYGCTEWPESFTHYMLYFCLHRSHDATGGYLPSTSHDFFIAQERPICCISQCTRNLQGQVAFLVTFQRIIMEFSRWWLNKYRHRETHTNISVKNTQRADTNHTRYWILDRSSFLCNAITHKWLGCN